MISAVILADGNERALAATLSALASAAIDGLVREVIVADAAADAGVAEVAEEAGARRFADQAEAVAAAKQPWLLILAAGARPQVGWESAARGHIGHFPLRAARFRLSLSQGGARARFAEFGAAWFGAPRLEQGLLVARDRYGRGLGRVRRLEARVLVER